MRTVTRPSAEELRRFVIESNAIEGIPFSHDLDSTFEDHLSTAQWVVEEVQAGRLVHPVEIHRRLMRRLLPPADVGAYRRVMVRVGVTVPPPPDRVPKLFDGMWSEALRIADSSTSPHDVWSIHHQFECIHPFVDGNGRTGRLLLNELMLYCGQPWTVISSSEREAYYAQILAWIKLHGCDGR